MLRWLMVLWLCMALPCQARLGFTPKEQARRLGPPTVEKLDGNRLCQSRHFSDAVLCSQYEKGQVTLEVYLPLVELTDSIAEDLSRTLLPEDCGKLLDQRGFDPQSQPQELQVSQLLPGSIRFFRFEHANLCWVQGKEGVQQILVGRR